MTTTKHLVPFKGEAATLLERNGEPWVPIPPICDRLGLNRQVQARKLASEPRWRGGLMAVPSAGGEQETWAIPLRMLPAWLFSISASKVAPEARDALVAFQDECADVLWRHWSGRQSHRLERLEREAARAQALVKAYSPVAAKLAALQEARVGRSEVGHYLRSWSRQQVFQVLSDLEEAGVIVHEAWFDEQLRARVREFEAAEAQDLTPMERLIEEGAADA